MKWTGMSEWLQDRPEINRVAGAILVSLTGALAIAALWRLEEPSSMRTVECAAVATAVGLVTIMTAARANVIVSPRKWSIAFLLKLILTTLILKYSWLTPFQGNFRRIDDTDQAAYDFYGKALAESEQTGDSFSGALRGMTSGAIWYVEAVYRAFGVSTLYVALWNCVLALGGAISAAGLLRCCFPASPVDCVRYVLFFPELALLEAVPGKEAPTTFAFTLALLMVLQLATKKARRGIVISTLGVAVAILAIMRPQLILVLCAIGGLHLLWTRRLRSLVVLVGVAGICGTLLVVVGGSTYEALQDAFSQEVRTNILEDAIKYNPSTDPDRRGVHDVLANRSWLDAVWKGPVRVAVLVVGPYPKILPDVQRLPHLWTDYTVGVQEVYQKLSAAWILFLLPAAYCGLWKNRLADASGRKFLIIALSVGVYSGANAGPLVSLRYRDVFAPLFACAAIGGLKCGGVASRTRTWLGALVAVAGIYYIYVITGMYGD